MKNILKITGYIAAFFLTIDSTLAQIDSSLLAGLRAREIGPAVVSGRITAIDAVNSNPDNIVVGTATGGVWISKNGGTDWVPVFEKEACASIGAVAINQNNPDLIWVGTGESNMRNSTSIGCGIFKSVDGGNSWSNAGLEDSEHIGRISLHPDNPDIAYVAALGKLWASNEERGLYKTTDGGNNWKRVLYVDENTGASDVQMDPTNPNKLFASMWQFRRWPHFFNSGGPGSGLYVSHDAGENWEQFSEEDGMPEGELGRAAFSISPSNPQRVYALVESKKTTLLQSNDGGDSWKTINTETYIGSRPFYYSHIVPDPQNPEVLYHLTSRLRKSIDGGKTFSFVNAVDCCAPGNFLHVDIHALWINPNETSHLIIGGDAGLGVSRNSGDTARFVGNLPLAQFYHIAVDNDLDYHVYGGMQDNGAWRGAGEVFENGEIRNFHWQEVGMGDGFDTLPDPENSRRGITETQGGNLIAWNLDDHEQRIIRPNGPADGTELRFNWNSGMAQSPFDANTIYYGSQFLHKSIDRGETWQIISDDLTTNNPEFLSYKESGGLTPESSSAENHMTIVSISPSPVSENVIWVGTDDGRVHVTRDGGNTWESAIDNLRRGPQGAWVPMIDPSHHNPAEAFVVFDDHRRGDNSPHVYKVENYGRSWNSLVSDDISGYALSIRQDHMNSDLLFLGTEFGLYISVDGGQDWTKWTAGLPTVSVMDLAIQERENDLVIGTHGRGAFIIDDYSALRELDTDSFEASLDILTLTDGLQYTPLVTPSTRFAGSGEYRGENEPYGVLITFMASGDNLNHPDPDENKRISVARRAAMNEQTSENSESGSTEEQVTIEVEDANGDLIRTFKSDIHLGINRIVWSMQQDGLIGPPPAPPSTDGIFPPGIDVFPGTYTITLRLGDLSDSAEVEVIPDPLSSYSLADQRRNYEARLVIKDLTKKMNQALSQVMNASRDVETLERILASVENEEIKEALSSQIGEVKQAIETTEKLFRNPAGTQGSPYSGDKISSIIRAASSYVMSTRAAPNPAAAQQITKAETELDGAIEQVNRLITIDVAELRTAVENANIGLFNQTEI